MIARFVVRTLSIRSTPRQDLMKAAVLTAINKPLSVESIPIPQPKDGEVLVRNKACGVCHTDLHVMKGEVAFPLPCVLGHETVGEVVESRAPTSPTSQPLKAGDKVVSSFIMPCGHCHFCVRGKEDLCETFFALNRGKGVLYDGTSRLKRPTGSTIFQYSMSGFAEYSVVPATNVFSLPPDVPYEEASIVGCAQFTAFGAVKNAAQLTGGQTVAVIGTGGVGQGVLQLCKAFGAGAVIAIDIKSDKLQAAKSLGATHTINASEGNVPEAIRQITNGRGVDIAIECLGSPKTVQMAIESVRDGGKAVIVGIAPIGVQAAFDITRIVRRQIQIVGSYGGRARTDIPEILKLIQAGKIDIVSPITKRYALDDAQTAFDELNRGNVVGRSIVRFF